MYQRWAEILGNHAAKVFYIMSGLRPDRMEIAEADIGGGPRYPLGVRVDFSGHDSAGRPVGGFFVCAFDTTESAADIASTIAIKLGLAPPPPGDSTDIDNVLGEFLNIVIGLTCSDWAEHGLTTEFDPPQALSMHGKTAMARSKAYHLTMATDYHPTVSIFLVFLPPEAVTPPAGGPK
ncbi:MAG: hypothetical protein LBF58_06850 [Deltaproteobacteria bacterium]|nr:hypothetical protein [Deltaproteobacteria bacterium]